MNRSGRIHFIDALRGIAAISVVFVHLSEAAHLNTGLEESWLTRVLSYGGHGVDVFFVISGFVIAFSTAGGRHSLNYFLRFVARRITRLDIPYWLAIALEIAAVWMVGLVIAQQARPLPDPANIVINAMYLQLFLRAPEILIVAWSLCYEVQFYLVFVGVLCLYAGLRRLGVRALPRHTGRLLLLASGIYSILVFSGHLPTLVHGLFIDRWFEFALGVTAYLFFTRQLNGLHVLLASCIVLVPFLVGDPHMHRLTVSVACVATLLTICMARNSQAWEGMLSRPSLLFLGKISYSLYLLHATVGWRVTAVTGRSAVEAGIPAWAAAALCFTFGVACSIAVAWVAYRLIERPSIRLARRISLPTQIEDQREGRHLLASGHSS